MDPVTLMSIILLSPLSVYKSHTIDLGETKTSLALRREPKLEHGPIKIKGRIFGTRVEMCHLMQMHILPTPLYGESIIQYPVVEVSHTC